MGDRSAGRRETVRKSTAGVVTALTASAFVPLAFTAIDALPAEAVQQGNRPSPSPSATCALKQCGPAFLIFPANNVSARTTEGSPIAIDVLAHDCDSSLPDQKYLFSTSPPKTPKGVAVGKVKVNSDNELVFTPVKGFAGRATFSYSWRLTKGFEINPANGKTIRIKGASSTAIVTIDVNRARR